jgi:hypothetical protein
MKSVGRLKGHQNISRNFIRASFAHHSLIVGGSEVRDDDDDVRWLDGIIVQIDLSCLYRTVLCIFGIKNLARYYNGCAVMQALFILLVGLVLRAYLPQHPMIAHFVRGGMMSNVRCITL